MFVLCLFFKEDQLSESKQLNRSIATSHFLEELKRKSKDSFGNSSGNESTRSSEIEISKSTENNNSFSKAKKPKVLNFQERLLVFQMRIIRAHRTSLKKE